MLNLRHLLIISPLIFTVSSVMAGEGLYIHINNTTTKPITVTLLHHNCIYHWKRLKQFATIQAGSMRKFILKKP